MQGKVGRRPYRMALIFDLIRSDRTRVTFMTEDKVLEVLLVIDLLNNII